VASVLRWRAVRIVSDSLAKGREECSSCIAQSPNWVIVVSVSPVGASRPAVIAEDSRQHLDLGSLTLTVETTVLRKCQRECSARVARDQHWRSAGDHYMGCSEKVYPTPPLAWPHEPTNPRGALHIGMTQGSDFACRDR
jgi:hypothetical protein